MTESAIALYLGESYATLKVFDPLNSKDTSSSFEKAVYLPQTSLKSLLNQTKVACDNKNITAIYIVTRYMDRLKNFRLGGSVVQVVPKGFENSYSLSNTSLQSLAAPALILTVTDQTDEVALATELARLKKINSEINKVVIQLPENLFSNTQIGLITDFFKKENFKIFSCAAPYDLEDVRKILLNAGSEGTKEELIADIKDALGENVAINFWVQGKFSKTFESIDLYFSSHCFLRNYLQRKNIKQAFYFDMENWNSISTEINEKWHSPWGGINYAHPRLEEFSLSPYCELTVNSVGQLIASKSPPQFEPGPIVAGRSVKALILDAYAEELQSNKTITSLFPLLATDAIQKKVNTQFQILHKAQTLDEIRLSREDIKQWLNLSVVSWITQKNEGRPPELLGDLASFFCNSILETNKSKPHDFSWTEQIIFESSLGNSI